MKKIIFVLGIVSLLVLSVPAHAAVCTDITVDIGSGSTDKTTGNNVTKFQNYLKDTGYLTATPNGVFGPATLAAVKKFQAAQGISATGFVGPTTRAFIKTKTCTTVTTPSIPSTPSTPAVSTKTPTISVPKTGAVITMGKNQIIRWPTAVQSTYSIILEDSKGISAGYIATTRLGGTEFEWRAGDVYSTESDKNLVVAPGDYKIRIRKTHSGTSEDDPQSGVFTLLAQPTTASMIYPRSISAIEEPLIVLYGSGFNSATSLYLDGPFNIRTTKHYVSPDGKIIIFSVPTDLAQGSHRIWAYNGSNSVDLEMNIAAL